MSALKPREQVLQIVRNILGDNSQESEIKGRIVFCPSCGNDITKGNNKPGQKLMICSKCNYQGNRAFIFDDKVKWKFNDSEYADVPPGELIHFSVGAKIKQKDRYLLFRRTLHPVGEYTIPAGHLEKEEDPRVAAIKEAYEETGLGILSIMLEREHLVIKEPCRRSTEYHVWNLYTCEAIGEARMSYEADIIGWYSLDEIRALPLTIPTRLLFELVE